jgi:RNA polymerase sigma factor (sigma-70 family)
MPLWPDSFGDWAQQLHEQGAVHAAAFQVARNCGAWPDRANDLAEQAEAHGLEQAALHIGTPGHFASYEHFRNWVRRCAVNHVRDQFRRGRRALQLDTAEAVPAPEQVMDAEETERVRQCWDNLDERDRALLQRHFLDGLDYDAMANEFLPPDERSANARRLAIRRQVLAARGRFWQCLLDHGIDPRFWGCQE